jgi:hypothetical protein
MFSQMRFHRERSVVFSLVHSSSKFVLGFLTLPETLPEGKGI